MSKWRFFGKRYEGGTCCEAYECVLVYDINTKSHKPEENDNVSFVREHINAITTLDIPYQVLCAISHKVNNKFILIIPKLLKCMNELITLIWVKKW